jgi:REP element-mobilizing transposase RayT
MANHVHLVVGVPGDPDPARLLQAFKAYASRALNRDAGGERRWWTESGSRRILRGSDAVVAAVRYVMGQEYPLVLWSASDADDPPAPASGRR